jgi:NCS1 family nucleobase:cation symporter-1
VHGVDLGSASPTQAIASLLGSGTIATLVLITVVLGTLTANCMNLYSGAMAALVVKFPEASWRTPLLLAAVFGALTGLLFAHAKIAAPVVLAFSIGVALVVLFIARYRLRRWRAAIVVGALGALLASGGGHPAQTAQLYTNFLLLLSYWASPWAAVVFVDWLQRRNTAPDAQAFDTGPRVRAGTYAWIAGLIASLPFWNQEWYTGPFAVAFPQFGDLSYYVGFAVAALVMAAAAKRESSAATPSMS